MEDLTLADVVVSFTETPRETLTRRDVLGATQRATDEGFLDFERLQSELNRRAGKASRGGRHVEFGMALALHKRLIIANEVFRRSPRLALASTR